MWVGVCRCVGVECERDDTTGRSSDDVKNPMFALFIIGAFFAIYVQCVFLNKVLLRCTVMCSALLPYCVCVCVFA
jgi:hypothetical protein